MSHKIDFEIVMEETKDIVVSNLPAKITAMNTDKGDTLLEAFDSDAYFLYRLSDTQTMPNFGVFFTQYISSSPVTGEFGLTAIQFDIAFDVVVNFTNDGNADIRLLRYLEIMRQILDEDVIQSCFPSASIISPAGYVQGTDKYLQGYLIGQLVVANFIS